MNIRSVVKQLGLVIIILSGSIVISAAYSAYRWLNNGQAGAADLWAFWALLITVMFGLALGFLLWRYGGRGDEFLGRREALLLVAISYLGGALLASLPYYLWTILPDSPNDHPFHSFVNCYFEAVSGLTTTGATVLSDVASLPPGLLLWRATTQWLGGLGIVVLFVAVLPMVGVGGKRLFQVETTGPRATGIRPRIREAARLLWLIYLGMTVAETVALRLCGMTWFDAICHTFTTVATAGFSTTNAGIGGYPAAAQWVIVVFMIGAGVNFGLYYHLIRRRFRDFWSDPELRLYLGIMFIGSVVIVATIVHHPIATTAAPAQPVKATLGEAVRHGIFQAVSIQTTTGFSTVDFGQWGFVPKAVLLTLMFVGASAGSTGGGIKVIRILVAFKVMLAEIERVFRPSIVRTVKVGRTTVDPELRQGTLVYVLGILLLFLMGAVLLMVFESGQSIDFTTAASASAATLNNIGPGLGRVGAIENFGWFTAPSKIVMCLLMVLGRLEVFAIFVLFMPRFWRSE